MIEAIAIAREIVRNELRLNMKVAGPANNTKKLLDTVTTLTSVEIVVSRMRQEDIDEVWLTPGT